MDLDHRRMTPPFIRESHRARSGETDVIVWDLRIGQPNVSRVPAPVMHSMEHALIAYLRRDGPAVIHAAPMGCGTGLYLVTFVLDFEEIARLVASALESLLRATEVPMADTAQCGAAEHHTLSGAQEVARWLLRHRAEWAQALDHPDDDR
ncbi:S-ribosylhomocysteine lyase /quorum-sensing autoinducer 2 (AI-2) synthesis protein LuxS [Actinacidiphila alni]|uniref:S-ribosylhomocysteine lyase n=1 Tax=Actinacidiphila alni TaxID=380248 RepID=A0A1I2AKH9_9ACTN|nr:S-ribosylhomocysteine lyase [Actinacidiphila alni]SFE43453.1 S-ribosylhomocysteine lyase /quorum-sensing autoinducer 2 (AI-2) synthesis protein LuxS [Actinacidiphila alni]